MNSYNQDNRSSGGRDSRKRRFGGRDSGRSSMHKAICDECGKECEVPFRPTGDKPVYCSECFEKRGNVSPRRSGGGDFRRPSFDDKQMFQAVCDECGRECEVPFRPTGDKPVYCSRCFESKGNISPRRSGGRDSRRQSFDDKQMFRAVCDECGDECEVPFRPTSGKPVFCSRCFEKRDTSGGKKAEKSVDEFQILNSKLDKILQLLNPFVSVKPVKKKEVIKEKKVAEPEKPVKKTITPKKTVKKKVKAKKAAVKKEK
jgi:CxxC-x17-CxxC domain-containing protein